MLDLVLDKKSQVLIRGSRAARLAPAECMVLQALLKKPWVSGDDLRNAVWGTQKGGGPPTNALSANLCRLKNKIEPLDLTVIHSRNTKPRTYRLIAAL